jgi:hypothetical protein
MLGCGQSAEHRAFERGGVGAFGVVAAGLQAGRDAHRRPGEGGCAGEGGALLNDGLDDLQRSLIQLRRGLRDHLRFERFARCFVGADDQREHALRTAELAAVEHELCGRCGRIAAQGQHRFCQLRGAAHVDRGDGFEAQRLGRLAPAVGRHVRCADEPRGVPWGASQDDLIEDFVIDAPLPGLRCDGPHARADAHVAPCSVSHAIAASGRSAPRSARGSSRSAPPLPLKSASRSTRRNTSPLDWATGVLSADTHSGSISSCITRGVRPAHRSATVVVLAQRNPESRQPMAVRSTKTCPATSSRAP